MVQRLALGQLTLDSKRARTTQGFLVCDAAIARTGIQTYTQPDGSQRREYRPPEEVFSKDAIESFHNAPITYTPDTPNMHPPGAVTADNADEYTVGLAGKELQQDGHLLVARAVVITHKDAIAAAENGSASGVSCGYTCRLDFTPGKTPDGETYDAVQREIRGNHIAMVHPSIARAGAEARFRLDSNDNAVHEAAHPPKEGTVKIRIAGVETDIPDIAAQLLEKERADAAAQLVAERKLKTDAEAATAAALKEAKDSKALVEAEKARADAAAEKAVKAEKARTDAEDPKALQAKIAARVELETKARAILGADAKLADKTDAEVKLAVVAKAHPDLKLDGKAPEYIAARFDMAVEAEDERHPMEPVRRALTRTDADEPEDKDEHEDGEMTVDEARAQMLKDRKNASKPAKK